MNIWCKTLLEHILQLLLFTLCPQLSLFFPALLNTPNLIRDLLHLPQPSPGRRWADWKDTSANATDLSQSGHFINTATVLADSLLLGNTPWSGIRGICQ